MKFKNVIIIVTLSISLYFGCRNSPSPTLQGDSKHFDSILKNADNQWSFLFCDYVSLLKVDAYGNSKELFNIKDYLSNENSNLGCGKISPHGKYIAQYYTSNDLKQQKKYGFALFDLTENKIHDLYPNLSNTRFTYKEFWLDSVSIIQPIYKERMSDTVLFVMHTLNDSLISCDTITWSVYPELKWDSNTNSVLYKSRGAFSTDKIYAIDISGNRLATPSEIEFFNKVKEYKSGELELMGTMQDVKFTFKEISWLNKCKNCYKLYLNEKLIRRTKGLPGFYPIGDEDLDIIIWIEQDYSQDKIYMMDKLGHYRFWHDGSYCGKISK